MFKDKSNRNTVLIHLFAWLVLLGMPLYNTRPDRTMVDTHQYVHFILTSASFMVLFYLNYNLLIRKFLFEKKVTAFLACNILAFTILFLLVGIIARTILPPPQFTVTANEVRPTLFRVFLGNSCLYLLVVGASVAVKMTSKWYQTEADKKEAEKNLTIAELENLKSQINPHFLFNTLNNIYTLIQINPEQAQQAIHDLSRSLRYVMYESNNNKVPVKAELEFIEKYVALMKMRLPRSVRMEISLPSAHDPVMTETVAPMLFIPLVENAFKHGVDPNQDSFINISIEGAENQIICRVTNSNHPKTDMDRSGSGIGLDNLKKRLRLIYPGKHKYHSGIQGNTYSACLELQLT